MARNLKNLDELTEYFITNYKLIDGEKNFKTYRAKIRRTLEAIHELNNGVPMKSQKTKRMCACYSEYQVRKMFQDDQFYDYLIKHSADETIKNSKTRKQLKAEIEEKNRKECEQAEYDYQYSLYLGSLNGDYDLKDTNFNPNFEELYHEKRSLEECEDNECRYIDMPLRFPNYEEDVIKKIYVLERIVKMLFEEKFTHFNEEQFFEDLRIRYYHEKDPLNNYGNNTVETEEALERLNNTFSYCVRK